MSAPSHFSGQGEVPAGLVRVLRGAPDEAELAALVAGIVAARADDGAAEPEEHLTSVWGDHGRRLGLPARPGGAAWRWSARAY